MPGRLHRAPAAIVQELIIELELGTDPSADPLEDWPVYKSREPDEVDDVIRVSGGAGTDDGDSHVDGEHGEHYGISILVRSADEEDGWDKINEIAVVLDEVLNRVVSVGGVTGTGTGGELYRVASMKRTSGPVSLGKDTPAGKRHTHSINFLASIREC